MGYRENPGWLRTAIGQGVDTFQQFRQLRDERLQREEDVAYRNAQAEEAKKQAEIARLSQQHQDGTLTLLGRKRYAELQGLDSVGESAAEEKKRLKAFANTKTGEFDFSPFGGTKFKIAGGVENMSDVDRKTIDLQTRNEEKVAGLQIGKLERDAANGPLERQALIQKNAREGGSLIAPEVVFDAAAKSGGITKVSYKDLLARANEKFATAVADPEYAHLSPSEREMARKAYVAAVSTSFSNELNAASERARNYQVGRSSGKTPEEKFVAQIQMQIAKMGMVGNAAIKAAGMDVRSTIDGKPTAIAEQLKTDTEELGLIAMRASSGDLAGAQRDLDDWHKQRQGKSGDIPGVGISTTIGTPLPPQARPPMQTAAQKLIEDQQKKRKQ